MAANKDDKFKKVGRSTATTLSSPGYTIGNTSINVASTANWPTDTGVTFAVDEVDADGVRVNGTYNIFKGVVSSATQISSVEYVGGDANRDYSAGATTRVYIDVDYSRHNELVDGLLAEHNQDGTHSDVTADTVTATTVTADSIVINGAASSEGWAALGDVPDTVTANGNRSYDLVFNGNDLTDTISPGMRLQLTRTVAAPDQCTSLNGSTQYWSKSSPSGLSNWTAYTNIAHIYPTAYQDATISRCVTSTTNGWALTMLSTGQIRAFYGTASNFTDFVTYQSVPLNRWSHVAVRVTSTASKTAEILINGVVVPSYSAITAATSMTQGGTLTIGATSTPNTYFPGKLAQVGLFSAALTAQEILDYSTYGLSGSETSCVGFFSFDGNSNDSSSSANNLTASGSATATEDDSPFENYGATTNKEYAIVMKAAFSTNTTLTVQVPDGCAIPTSGGVSAVYYSTQSVPYGFPRAKGRWTLETVIKTQVTKSGASATWYEVFRIKIPAGAWMRGYKVSAVHIGATSVTRAIYTALSETSAASATDYRMMAQSAATATEVYGNHYVRGEYYPTTMTTNYLNIRAGSTAANSIAVCSVTSDADSVIFAENAYL